MLKPENPDYTYILRGGGGRLSAFGDSFSLLDRLKSILYHHSKGEVRRFSAMTCGRQDVPKPVIAHLLRDLWIASSQAPRNDGKRHSEGEARRISFNERSFAIAQDDKVYNNDGEKRPFGFHPQNDKKKAAFTLAEVLITLGIIGIVAAMTMPMLVRDYRKLVLENLFKKGYSIAQQVILQAVANYGGEDFAKYCTTLDPNYKVDPDSGESNGVIPYPNNNFCYRILYNALNKSNTESMWINDAYTVIRKDSVRTYNNKQEVTEKDAYAGGGNIWRMRQNRDGAWMNFHINEGKVYVTLDTNGYKKPNQLGHDIFRFYINPKNNTLTPIKQTKAYTDEELKELDYKFEYQIQRAGDPCNSKSNQKANGIGCSYFAVNDINPDTGEKGYWKNLP